MLALGEHKIGRPAKHSKKVTKQSVLLAALALLDAAGERAVTFRALAQKLGVTPMAVSYHVGTRRGIFEGLVESVYRGVGEDLKAATPLQNVSAMLEVYCARVIAHPNLARCVLADPSLYGGQLKLLTDTIVENLVASGVTEKMVKVLLGVIVDYTHGFALAVASNAATGHAKVSTPDGLSVADYQQGLDWILSRITRE